MKRRSLYIALVFLLGLLLALAIPTGEPGQQPAETPAFRDAVVTPVLSLPEEPWTLRLPDTASRDVVFLLFVDGLAAGPFEDALLSGGLPAIEALLSDRPSLRGRALSTFPSSTAPAVPEALSGSWSHHLGAAPSRIHAFNRQEQRLLRYEVETRRWDGEQLTLFDLATASGGEALSYFEGYFTGASLNVHEEVIYLLDLAEERVQRTRMLDYDRRMIRDLTARLVQAERAPSLVFIRFGAVDTAGHFFGPDSAEYVEAIRAVDQRVGELLDALELAQTSDGRSLAEQAHFVLFSDHGMTPTRAHVDLDERLRKLGMSPWSTSTPESIITSFVMPSEAQEHDVVAVPGGSNLAEIWLRARSGRIQLPWSKSAALMDPRAWPLEQGEVDLVDGLARTPGVDWVAWREGPNRIRVHRADGPGAVAVRRLSPTGAWRLAWLVEDPLDDPIGSCEVAGSICCEAGEGPPEERCFLSVEEWFQAPGGPRRAAAFWLFKAFGGQVSERPDLLVTAVEGFGFMGEVRGDHGAMRDSLMEVPLAFAGPRIDSDAELLDARLIDLAPTLLPLLGAEGIPVRMDGRPLGVIRERAREFSFDAVSEGELKKRSDF